MYKAWAPPIRDMKLGAIPDNVYNAVHSVTGSRGQGHAIYIYIDIDINLGLMSITICNRLLDLKIYILGFIMSLGLVPYGMHYVPRLNVISERGRIYVFCEGFPL